MVMGQLFVPDEMGTLPDVLERAPVLARVPMVFEAGPTMMGLEHRTEQPL